MYNCHKEYEHKLDHKGGHRYEKISMKHNAYVRNLRIIPIKYLYKDIDTLEFGVVADVFPSGSVKVPLRKYFFNVCKVVSVTNTKNIVADSTYIS